MSKPLDPRVEQRILDAIAQVTAHTGSLLSADMAVMLVVQGSNSLGAVQLADDIRARGEIWRTIAVRELRAYADAIDSGQVRMGQPNTWVVRRGG